MSGLFAGRQGIPFAVTRAQARRGQLPRVTSLVAPAGRTQACPAGGEGRRRRLLEGSRRGGHYRGAHPCPSAAGRPPLPPGLSVCIGSEPTMPENMGAKAHGGAGNRAKGTYQDRDKPSQIRFSNISAGKGEGR